jgi:hypothetical protein
MPMHFPADSLNPFITADGNPSFLDISITLTGKSFASSLAVAAVPSGDATKDV